jgi:hypothetical protein
LGAVLYLIKMEKEFVVSFVTSEQITECSWNVRTPSMKIKPETTVAEIEAFYRKWNKVGQMEVKIVELELIA